MVENRGDLLAKAEFSRSETRGINLISDDDIRILSVGISTGGIAEMLMAHTNSERKIIATTIDKKGAAYAEQKVSEYGFNNQVEIRLEDVRQAMEYEDYSMDYIYARLVLHYLSKKTLILHSEK